MLQSGLRVQGVVRAGGLPEVPRASLRPPAIAALPLQYPAVSSSISSISSIWRKQVADLQLRLGERLRYAVISRLGYTSVRRETQNTGWWTLEPWLDSPDSWARQYPDNIKTVQTVQTV